MQRRIFFYLYPLLALVECSHAMSSLIGGGGAAKHHFPVVANVFILMCCKIRYIFYYIHHNSPAVPLCSLLRSGDRTEASPEVFQEKKQPPVAAENEANEAI